jgi:hypothetical protein
VLHLSRSLKKARRAAGRKEAGKLNCTSSPHNPMREFSRSESFYFFLSNPLKRPDSTKEKQGNASLFACFFLDLLGPSSRIG